jgi:hypothetical protein
VVEPVELLLVVLLAVEPVEPAVEPDWVAVSPVEVVAPEVDPVEGLEDVAALVEPPSLPPVVPPEEGAVSLDVAGAGAVSSERATVPRTGLRVRATASSSDSAAWSRL